MEESNNKFNLDGETKDEILSMLDNICEQITKKTGVAGGILVKKEHELSAELDYFGDLIHKNNDLELENKLSSILDQFINILKDLKEEQKKWEFLEGN